MFMKKIRARCFLPCFHTSPMGETSLLTMPSTLSSWKTGDSLTLRRMTHAAMVTKIELKKTRRQP